VHVKDFNGHTPLFLAVEAGCLGCVKQLVNHGALDLLKYLNEKYQLGVISNCLVSRKYYEMKEFDLEKYFDTVTLSREINIDKPNPGIFLYALDQVKKKPGECAFIDNKVENLESAKKLGFGKLIFLVYWVLSREFLDL